MEKIASLPLTEDSLNVVKHSKMIEKESQRLRAALLEIAELLEDESEWAIRIARETLGAT